MEGEPGEISNIETLRARQREINDEVTRLEKEKVANLWLLKFEETLLRGGAATSPPPYDIEGVWRLALNRNPDSLYLFEPVILDDELPAGIEATRTVVPAAEARACPACGELVHLLGSNKPVAAGMGDIGEETEIAVVHCNEVHILSSNKEYEIYSLDKAEKLFSFTPHE